MNRIVRCIDAALTVAEKRDVMGSMLLRESAQ